MGSYPVPETSLTEYLAALATYRRPESGTLTFTALLNMVESVADSGGFDKRLMMRSPPIAATFERPAFHGNQRI